MEYKESDSILLEKFKKKFEHADRFAELMGLQVVEGHLGYGKVSLPFCEKLTNASGSPQGGALFALADIAFALACNYGEETIMVTSNANMAFIRGTRKGPLTAEGKKIAGGRKLANYLVEVRDGDGELIATGLFEGYRTKAPLF